MGGGPRRAGTSLGVVARGGETSGVGGGRGRPVPAGCPAGEVVCGTVRRRVRTEVEWAACRQRSTARSDEYSVVCRASGGQTRWNGGDSVGIPALGREVNQTANGIVNKWTNVRSGQVGEVDK